MPTAKNRWIMLLVIGILCATFLETIAGEGYEIVQWNVDSSRLDRHS